MKIVDNTSEKKKEESTNTDDKCENKEDKQHEADMNDKVEEKAKETEEISGRHIRSEGFADSGKPSHIAFEERNKIERIESKEGNKSEKDKSEDQVKKCEEQKDSTVGENENQDANQSEQKTFLEVLSLLSTENTIKNLDKNKRSPLHSAAIAQQWDLIPLLIESGADIDALDIDNRTPLAFALMYKDCPLDKVHMLISSDNINIRESKGHNEVD